MPTGSPSRRRRISQACRPCSKRKVKCDGGVPRCGRCTSDNVQCSYGISKRNKWLSPSSSHAPVPAGAPENQLQLPSQDSLSERFYGSGTTPSVTDSAPSIPHYITAVPFRVSRQLFQAYFRCIHPIWPVLYKPLYSSLDHEQVLKVLPQPLVYAILSLAVMIHESETDQPSKYDQAQKFFDAALRTLRNPDLSQNSQSLLELKPSITNCQVYTILALQQHGIGEISQAGTLCAIASSMAIDQSLHRKSDTDNHVEAQIKSRLWWTIYVLEKMLSCEMGRPTLLRAEEAETPFPSVEESDEYEFYFGSTREDTILNYQKHNSLKLRTVSAFHTSIRIAMIMENISREVYSIAAQQRFRNDREAGEETRIRLWAELQEYEIAMERSPLKLDMTGNSASVPVTVTNYIFMWSTTILLHRPFIENWQSSSSDAATSLLHKEPSEICLFAANKICSVIEMYARYMCGLPSDLIFPIFVAANILLRHWQRTKVEDVAITTRLDLCVGWLNGLGKSWKNAERRHQMLADSIHYTSQDTQTGTIEPPIVVPLQNSETSSSFNNYSNLTLLSQEDNFDLEYLQWVNTLDMQNLFERHSTY